MLPVLLLFSVCVLLHQIIDGCKGVQTVGRSACAAPVKRSVTLKAFVILPTQDLHEHSLFVYCVHSISRPSCSKMPEESDFIAVEQTLQQTTRPSCFQSNCAQRQSKR